jgi:hypothetical protein
MKACEMNGILIDRITRDFVYLKDNSRFILPNNTSIKTKTPILVTWKTKNSNGEVIVLKDTIKAKETIATITIIRHNTGLSLIDSSRLTMDNFDSWVKKIKKDELEFMGENDF